MNRLFDITTSNNKRLLIPSNRLIGIIESGEIKLFFEDDVKVIVKIKNSEREGFMDWLKKQLSVAAQENLAINLSETATPEITSIEY
jgi:hypothetical protein